MGEAANEGANLAVGKTATPEFLRHKCRKQLRRPHVSVVLGNKSIGVVVGGGTLSKCRGERGKGFSSNLRQGPVVMCAFLRVSR